MRLELDGTGIEVEITGDDDAPPVLLIHGWPDTHAIWRHQVPALVEAGYRTIAPDLRGFGGSDRPADVQAAHILHHLSDLANLLDHLGIERTHVVGHDWGAVVAWALAGFLPDRVDHLVSLSIGHPVAFSGASLAQKEKSWYMLLFQFEEVAEEWISADDFANLRAWSRHPELDEVASRLADRDALTASLAIYRANVPPESLLTSRQSSVPPVAAPTLGVWSSGDMGLTEEQMVASAEHVTGPWRYERIDDVGHWMQLEAPDRVNELLLDFLPR
jgi:pimeloyl-ACP methyl ester carboxylesterase